MKNQFVQMLVELHKKGVLHLTDAGIVEFIKLMQDGSKDEELKIVG